MKGWLRGELVGEWLVSGLVGRGVIQYNTKQ